MVHQVRGAFRHAPAAATGTESTTLAREGHKAILATLIATESSKAACQAPTRQTVAELSLNEARQALTIAKRRRLYTERLEVFEHDLMKHLMRGTPRLVCRGRLGHAKRRGRAHANR